MYGIIATWRMALEGAQEGLDLLKKNHCILDALEKAVIEVENHPDYHSVGFSGLPNVLGEVELDAAFMDGDSLKIGAVAGLGNYKNPVSLARRLLNRRCNNFLVGPGAEAFAERHGFKKERLLTPEAESQWQRKKDSMNDLMPYDGHDTVGMVGLDKKGKMAAATSTSGLFLKDQGRVGDSPLSGSGYYADSEIGAATATGLGEDIMKGCISYQIVEKMKMMSPQEAADQVVQTFSKSLKMRHQPVGDISVVCMNRKGEWGAATNTNHFSFVVANGDQPGVVFIARCQDHKTIYERASQEWIRTHTE
jgi:N4-(beta-N-acetylglucosaminyl)-L-asparaginase